MRIVMLANARSAHTQRWAGAYAARGHEVHVVGIRHAVISGVEVHAAAGPAAGSGAFRSLFAYLRLLFTVRRMLRRLEPNVVHAHYSVTHGAIAVLARLHPVVLTVWGTDIVSGDRAVRGPKRWLNRFVLRRVDAVTGASRFLVDRARRVAGPDVAIHHVPFGVDTGRFVPAPVPPPGFVVGWAKGLRRRYDPWTLLEAFRSIAAEVPDSRLVMAGGGPLQSRIDRAVVRWGLSDRVDILGPIPEPVMPAVLQGFDVLATTSRSESFGVVLLEASSSGLPVVATRVGGVPETVGDGITGILVPVGDSQAVASALLRIGRDPGLARTMGEAGRAKVVSEYEWSACVDKMVALLEGVGR